MATGIQTGMRSLKSRGQAAEPTLGQRAVQSWQKLGRSWKLGLFGVALVVLAVAGAGTQYRQVTAPVSLYSFDLESEAVRQVAVRLTQMGVDHEVDERVARVLVPREQAPGLRLVLAEEGLPDLSARVEESNGMVGPGVEQLHRQHYAAMEQELAQALRQVSGVANATVKLVPAEDSYFVDDSRPATASVFLKLWPGAKLSGKQVEGVTHLVAFSVPQLQPEQVKVVDHDGNVLVPQGRQNEFELGLQHQLEGHQARLAQQMLDKVLGPGRAVVAVNTEFDMSEVEIKRSDVGGPGETMVVIGKQRKEERFQKDEGSDYETIAEAHKTTADQSFVWTVHKTPRIKRVTVSLAVDNLQPRLADEMAGLVKGAVGFDESRGDFFALASVPFDRAVAQPVPDPPVAVEAAAWPTWPALAAGGFVLLGLAWSLGRFSRSWTVVDVYQPTMPCDAISELKTQSPDRETAVLSCQRIEAMARERPDSVAKLLSTTWLS